MFRYRYPVEAGGRNSRGQGRAGGREAVIDISAANEVRTWGAGSPDGQGDKVWQGLPAPLCLLGHPFD